MNELTPLQIRTLLEISTHYGSYTVEKTAKTNRELEYMGYVTIEDKSVKLTNQGQNAVFLIRFGVLNLM